MTNTTTYLNRPVRMNELGRARMEREQLDAANRDRGKVESARQAREISSALRGRHTAPPPFNWFHTATFNIDKQFALLQQDRTLAIALAELHDPKFCESLADGHG